MTRVMLSLGLCVLLSGKTFPGPLPHSSQTWSLSRQPDRRAGRTGHCSFYAFQVLLPWPWGTAHNLVFSRTNGLPPPRRSPDFSQVSLCPSSKFCSRHLVPLLCLSPPGSLRGSPCAPFWHLLWESLPGRQLGPSRAPLGRSCLSRSTQPAACSPVS